MADDGFGPAVVRRLMEQCGADAPERASSAPQTVLVGAWAPDVQLVVGEVAGMALLPWFRRCRHVVVVDAIDAGAEPGAIFRFDADEAGIAQLRSASLHGLGVPHLVANARLTGASPQVVVLAVQVQDVRPRPDALSEPVAAAVEPVRLLVIEELRRLGAGDPEENNGAVSAGGPGPR